VWGRSIAGLGCMDKVTHCCTLFVGNKPTEEEGSDVIGNKRPHHTSLACRLYSTADRLLILPHTFDGLQFCLGTESREVEWELLDQPQQKAP